MIFASVIRRMKSKFQKSEAGWLGATSAVGRIHLSPMTASLPWARVALAIIRRSAAELRHGSIADTIMSSSAPFRNERIDA